MQYSVQYIQKKKKKKKTFLSSRFIATQKSFNAGFRFAEVYNDQNFKCIEPGMYVLITGTHMHMFSKAWSNMLAVSLFLYNS